MGLQWSLLRVQILLQNATAFLLQSAGKFYHKMRQVFLLQYSYMLLYDAADIRKWINYYKKGHNIHSMHAWIASDNIGAEILHLFMILFLLFLHWDFTKLYYFVFLKFSNNTKVPVSPPQLLHSYENYSKCWTHNLHVWISSTMTAVCFFVRRCFVNDNLYGYSLVRRCLFTNLIGYSLVIRYFVNNVIGYFLVRRVFLNNAIGYSLFFALLKKLFVWISLHSVKCKNKIVGSTCRSQNSGWVPAKTG